MDLVSTLLGFIALIAMYTLILFIAFIWISMLIDAIKQGNWVWAILIVWLGWIIAFVYVIAVYKKSPVDELLIKPFRQGYKTGKKK